MGGGRLRQPDWLIIDSLPLIRHSREGRTLPEVPVVVLSATTDTPEGERETWTACHADLAASVPCGRHVVLAGASHAMNQDRAAEVAEVINRVIECVAPDSSAR
jgi:pimeloyl-ACP methyl ester carboxylesterase